MTSTAGTPGKPTRPVACLVSCIVAALVAILAAALDWSLIDWLPGLMFMPSHLVLTLIPLACGFVWATLELRNVRRGGLWHAAPFTACVAAIVLLQYAPFTRIWLHANFRLLQTERERIVGQIDSGELKPNVAHNASLIALGRSRRNVSAGGNEIKIEMRQGKAWVLFFTFRGINHYSGFLYVPDDGDPDTFADLAERRHQVVAFAPRWHFVAR